MKLFLIRKHIFFPASHLYRIQHSGKPKTFRLICFFQQKGFFTDFGGNAPFGKGNQKFSPRLLRQMIFNLLKQKGDSVPCYGGNVDASA